MPFQPMSLTVATSWPANNRFSAMGRFSPGRMRSTGRLMLVVEREESRDDISRDVEIFDQPVDPFVPVHQEILGLNSRAAQDRHPRHLAGHGLDQSAFGPVDTAHGRMI